MLNDFLGQAKARDFLESALFHPQRPPAYLFRGPEGVGKTTAALEFSRLLLCPESPPCAGCDSCTKAKAGAHPDLLVFRPEGPHFTVGMAAEVREAAQFRPYFGRCKVLVLDRVEACTLEAANALLKSLEDVPEHTLFILLQGEGKILPTIESRCVPVPFYHLSEEHIRSVLAPKAELPLTFEPSLAMGVMDAGEDYLRHGPLWNLWADSLRYFQVLMGGSLGDAVRLEKEMGKDPEALHSIFLFFQSFIRDIWQLKEGQDIRNKGLEAELSVYVKVATSTLFYLSNRISQFLLVVRETNPEIQLRAFLAAVLYVTSHASIHP